MSTVSRHLRGFHSAANRCAPVVEHLNLETLASERNDHQKKISATDKSVRTSGATYQRPWLQPIHSTHFTLGCSSCPILTVWHRGGAGLQFETACDGGPGIRVHSLNGDVLWLLDL